MRQWLNPPLAFLSLCLPLRGLRPWCLLRRWFPPPPWRVSPLLLAAGLPQLRLARQLEVQIFWPSWLGRLLPRPPRLPVCKSSFALFLLRGSSERPRPSVVRHSELMKLCDNKQRPAPPLRR